MSPKNKYHWIYFFLNLIGRPGYSARELNCQSHWNSIQLLLPVPMLLPSVGTKLDWSWTHLNWISRKTIFVNLMATKSVGASQLIRDNRYLKPLVVMFLEKLQSYLPLPSDLIFHLATLYRVSTTSNAEIRLRFYGLALKDPSSAAAKKFALYAVNWVIGEDETGVIKGRMKFCRPVFRDVFKIDQDLAVHKFLDAKMSFHPIARRLIEKVWQIQSFMRHDSQTVAWI